MYDYDQANNLQHPALLFLRDDQVLDDGYSKRV